MGSQAEYWTDIYATTHEQRLAESMAAARAELKDRYGLEAEYLKWLQDKSKMLEQERTKVQQSLDEYSRARGGKAGGEGSDDTAALLSVIQQAGATIGREAGEAAQRKLEAEAAVESRYRLTGEQSNAIGKAGDYFGKVDMTTATTSPDVQRIIDAAINEIGPGTFASGTDASKTGTAELVSRIDRALSRNQVYLSDPSLKQYVVDKATQKLGTTTAYAVRSGVDADKKAAISSAQKTVGVVATKESSDAAKLAKDALKNKLGGANAPEVDAVAEWVSSPAGAAYMSELQKTGDYDKALIAAAGILQIPNAAELAAGQLEQLVFNAKVAPTADEAKAGKTAADRDVRAILKDANASFDIVKFFDPGFIDLYGRSKSLEKDASETFGKVSTQWDTLRETLPTEEAARRRGTEIYEPISPGVGARRREAAVREEEARMRDKMRPSTGAGTVDDFLASRLTTPSIPEEQRVLAGASAAAVRFGAKSGSGSSDDLGYRMYSNVRERQLRDTTPKALVQHAADLAGGDAKKRDEILQGYYQYALGEKQGLEARKRETRIEETEAPAPLLNPSDVKDNTKFRDISGITSEDTNF
jgi:hypothetical protein